MRLRLHPQLTARQRQVLDFMRDFHVRNDQLPPMSAISKHFGWKSDNAAKTFADILEAKGYIEKNEVGKYRFTREEQPAAVPLDTLPGALTAEPVRPPWPLQPPVRRYIGT
jgi:SOS-response transcriptional repressor LexA